MKKNKIPPSGFTMLEMAIVLLIGGIIMMAGVNATSNYLFSKQVLITKNRMQDIDNALQLYVQITGVLPCAANLNDLQDSATFGRSISELSGGGCYATSGGGVGLGTFPFRAQGNVKPPTVATGSPANPKPYHIVVGAVPTRSLGLPDSEMADAWGNRFMYAVTDYLTNSTNGKPDLQQGAIKVVDGAGNTIVGSAYPGLYAQYVILSYGADRAGGWPIAGGITTPGVSCPAGTPEAPNCTLSKPTVQFAYSMLNSSNPGNMYDDYVIYHTNVGIGTSSTSQFKGMMAIFKQPCQSPYWATPSNPNPPPAWPWTMAVPGNTVAQPAAGCPVGYFSSISGSAGHPTYPGLPAGYFCCQYQGQ